MAKAVEKLRVEILRPVTFKGGRVEKGTVLEMEQKECADLNPEYVRILKAKSKKEKPAASDEDDEAGEDEAAKAEEAGGSDIDV